MTEVHLDGGSNPINRTSLCQNQTPFFKHRIRLALYDKCDNDFFIRVDIEFCQRELVRCTMYREHDNRHTRSIVNNKINFHIPLKYLSRYLCGEDTLAFLVQVFVNIGDVEYPLSSNDNVNKLFFHPQVLFIGR